MKIVNLNKELQSVTGVKIVSEGEPMTLKLAILNSLISVTRDDQDMDAKAKFQLGALANRVHVATDEIELTVDELKTIRDRSGKIYNQAILYPVWKTLDDSVRGDSE